MVGAETEYVRIHWYPRQRMLAVLHITSGGADQKQERRCVLILY